MEVLNAFNPFKPKGPAGSQISVAPDHQYSFKNRWSLIGTVGSGKSTGCVMHPFLNAMKQTPDEHGVRHYRHLVVRATYPALRSTTIKRGYLGSKIKLLLLTVLLLWVRYNTICQTARL